MMRDCKTVLVLIVVAGGLLAAALAIVYWADRPQPVELKISTEGT